MRRQTKTYPCFNEAKESGAAALAPRCCFVSFEQVESNKENKGKTVSSLLLHYMSSQRLLIGSP